MHRFLYSPTGLLATLVGEAASSFSPVLLLFTFAMVAVGPTLILSRLIAPRKTPNPVKFLPMESGQVPKGEGRTHFMMQYYSFVLMFVVFDVTSIFLYAWGSTILNLPKSATLPIIGFLAVIFASFAFALYQAGRKNIW